MLYNGVRTLCLSILYILSGCAKGPSIERFEFTRLCMGVQTRIVLYGPDQEKADDAARVAFDEIDRLEQVMSDYRPDSELMRLSAASGRGPQQVSADLHRVLERALEMAEATDGAFDPTLGPLTELWRETRKTGVAPDLRRLEAARTRTGWRNLSLGRLPATANLLLRDMKLDLGGIGKGFAADRARGVLRTLGHRTCMVALAGDIAVGDPPPEQGGWRVAVAGVEDVLLLQNTCVSTSGDAEQFVEIGGVRHAHILDPRTGLGITRSVQSTVIAPDGATADALGTALCVMPPERRPDLLAGFTGAHALIVDRSEHRRWESPEWVSLLAPPAAP